MLFPFCNSLPQHRFTPYSKDMPLKLVVSSERMFHSIQMNLMDVRKTLSSVKEQADELDATLIQVSYMTCQYIDTDLTGVAYGVFVIYTYMDSPPWSSG